MMDGAKVRGLLQANQRLIDGETPGDSSLQKSHTQTQNSANVFGRLSSHLGADELAGLSRYFVAATSASRQ